MKWCDYGKSGNNKSHRVRVTVMWRRECLCVDEQSGDVSLNVRQDGSLRGMRKGILTQKRRVGGPKDIGVLKKVHEGSEKASRGSKKAKIRP